MSPTATILSDPAGAARSGAQVFQPVVAGHVFCFPAASLMLPLHPHLGAPLGKLLVLASFTVLFGGCLGTEGELSNGQFSWNCPLDDTDAYCHCDSPVCPGSAMPDRIAVGATF